MKKNINPIIKTLISIVLLLSLSSCENIFSKLEPLESANSNSSDKAYIKINVVQESSERTIIPTIDLNLLSSISLRGRKADNNNVSDANLLSGSTWEAFSSQTLAVDPGEWEFNLSASLNINSNGATTLRGTKTVTLQQGETTTLNFTLAPSSSSTTTKGGLYVKVNFEDPSKKITKVVATLMDEAKENIQGDPQSITGTSIKSPTGSPRYIEYKISNSSTYGIEQGTYFLTLEFFAGSDSAGWVSLNTISSYVRINAYYTSAATFDLDLNELYTITYKYYLLDEELSSNTGISIAENSPSTILPTAFSRKSVITLPTLTHSNSSYEFDGWYKSTTFTDENKITGISKGTTTSQIFYAHFVESTVGPILNQINNMTNSDTIYAGECTLSADDFVSIAEALNTLATEKPEIEVTLNLSQVSGVTSITKKPEGKSALFEDNTNLAEITLPAGFTTASSLFKNCSKLHTVNFTGSLPTIPNNAFTKCTALEKITVDGEEDGTYGDYVISNHAIYDTSFSRNTLISYYGKAFEEEVTFRSGVKSIYNQAFEDCSITSVIIPDTVTTISDQAFSSCTKLTSITLPSGITSLGFCIFKSCTALENITIPASVQTIGSSTFSGCTSLETVTFEASSSLTSIGSSAFNGCSSLSSINLPSGISNLDDSTFKGCTALNTIVLPEGLSQIKGYAFWNAGVTEITLPTSLTTISAGAFQSCNITTVNYLGTEEQKNSNLTISTNGNECLSTATWNYQSSGNASIIAPSDTDFVTITDAAYYDISGMENNPVGPNDEYVFPKMKVLKREVTQAEYESFMTYETGFAPSEDEDAKATTSAYYVSWAEALIYCNLLSIHQGLEPVYQMRLNLDGTNKLYTDPADWVQDENTGIIVDANGKYYLKPSQVEQDEYESYSSYWQQDFNSGDYIVYNNAANGYRLPLVNEWAYITNLANTSTISGMTDNTKNVYEWCSGCNYMGDMSQSYIKQNMGAAWNESNGFVHDYAKPYIHNEEWMSNLGFRIIRYTLQDDFVNVEGQTNHEVYDGDYDTLQLNSINNGDTFNIKNLLVQKQEVSQSDYELFMKYTSGYEPAESGAAKKTTPAYYVSWAEAVIYCNMLSLAHDLTPVYGIKWNDGGTLTNHTDPKDWATKTDTGVTISDSKYSVTDNNSDAQKAYWIPDYKGNSYYFHIDNTANGYRLPTKTEWAYISGKVKNASSGSQLTNIGDNSSKNVNEWCLAFDNDGSAENYCYSTSEMGVAEFTTNNIFSTTNDSYDDQIPDSGTYVRITSHIGTSNIGFRVVRNAE